MKIKCKLSFYVDIETKNKEISLYPSQSYFHFKPHFYRSDTYTNFNWGYWNLDIWDKARLKESEEGENNG